MTVIDHMTLASDVENSSSDNNENSVRFSKRKRSSNSSNLLKSLCGRMVEEEGNVIDGISCTSSESEMTSDEESDVESDVDEMQTNADKLVNWHSPVGNHLKFDYTGSNSTIDCEYTTPLDFLRMFIDDEIFNLMIDQTNPMQHR